MIISTPLPSPPEPIRTAYAALIAAADRLVERLCARHRPHLRCRPGCDSCCLRFSVFALEAALIGEVAGGRPRSGGESCPLLGDGRCSVYPQRPLICRTQGLPIGYLDEVNEHIEVSVCPLNFSADHPFEHDDLLYLDPFNQRLAALNDAYCRAAGLAPGRRIDLG